MSEADLTYKLTAVYDLREWDDDQQCRIPIDDDMKASCCKCTRKHAKVYELTRSDGKIFTVGATCRKKVVGWTPDADEIKRLEKEDRERARNKAYQKRLAIAQPIADEILALPYPRIIELSRDTNPEHRIQHITWSINIPGSKVQVLSTVEEGLTDERRAAVYRAWMREEMKKRTEALYPMTAPTYSEDENFTKRYKLEDIVRDLLNLR